MLVLIIATGRGNILSVKKALFVVNNTTQLQHSSFSFGGGGVFCFQHNHVGKGF